MYDLEAELCEVVPPDPTFDWPIDWVFGCTTREGLDTWFEELEGFSVMIYEVDQQFVVGDKNQVAFDLSKATLIGEDWTAR